MTDERPVPNENGLRSLGREISRANGGRSRRAPVSSKRRRRLRRGLLIALAFVLIVVGGGAGYVYYLTRGIKRVEVHGLSKALTAGTEAGTENILMAGSTSRCALTVQNPIYGLCSQGVNGVNSDVIMILHVDPATHQLGLLSIPRDLFVPNGRADGAHKVDAALYEGLTQLVAAVEEDFGIPIQHAVSLNFDQFANIVNALGGINVSVPVSVYDAYSQLNLQAAKCVHLNGTQALALVRARHLQYQTPGSGTDARYWPQQGLSDIARIQRDHEFLRILATQVAQKGIDNPLTDIGLINSLKADITFDQSWSVTDMARLLVEFHAVHINSVPQLTLPVSVVSDPNGPGGSLIYEGGNFGAVEFPSQPQDLQSIDQVLGIGPTTDAMTGHPLPAASSVTVSVMNGTGVYNQATNTSDALAALGFHMVGVGDISPPGDVSETVVYYGSRSPAVEAAAEKVAGSMTGSVIMGYNPAKVADGAQVTVVTGSQFAVNSPPASGTTPAQGSGSQGTQATSGAGGGSTTATTVPSSAPSGSIAAPTVANMGLSSYDPRACPAGATPTAPVPNQT